MSLLGCIYGRNHNLLEWLAHLDVHLAAQCQYHGGNLLGDGHALLQVVVDGCLVGYWEVVQVNALQLATQVVIQLVGIEWSERSQEFGNGHQTSIERLVSAELILAHLLAPETFAVQANVPVGEVVVDESVDQATCTGWVVASQLLVNALDEGIERRENPAVDLWALLCRHLCCLWVETVHVGIEGEEAVCII